MLGQSRFSRRTIVKGAAAGAAALTIGGGPRPAAAEAVQIEYWNPGADPVGGAIIVQLVDQYNQTAGQEAGIFVNNVPVPDSNAYAKYSTAMTSSSSPDIVSTYSYDPVIPWIANGFVQSMDAQFQELGIQQDQFYPVAWDMISFNGHIWGLPQEFDMVEFFWNKEIHTGAPPTTIDELDALAADYNQFDGDGNLVQAGLIPWAQGGFSPGGYGSWGTIWGARFYDHANRKWTINRPENTRFLDWYLKYVDLLGGREKADAFISSVPRTYGDIFLYGKTAFAMEGEFVPKEMEKLGLTAQIDIAHSPVVPDLTTHTTMLDAANVYVLPVKSNHPAEGSAFAKYMVSKDALVAWSIPIGQMMPTKEAANAPELLAALPWMAIFNETVESGKLLPPPLSPQAHLFAQLMTTAIDEVTYKQKSPADALAEVEAKIGAAVADFQQQHPDWGGE